MEKDLKKTLANLEEERANSIKHKQVAVMLIKEQKKLIEKLVKDRQKINKYEEQLREEKDKTTNVVEGLVQESKKSLKMEAAMEKQLSDFDVEREQLRGRLAKEESKNRDLSCQVESLQHQLDLMQKQLMLEKTGTKDAFQSIEIKSSATPGRAPAEKYGGSSLAVVSPTLGKTVPKYSKADVYREQREDYRIARSREIDYRRECTKTCVWYAVCVKIARKTIQR